MTHAIGYLAALVTFVVADMVWLGTMTPSLLPADAG